MSPGFCVGRTAQPVIRIRAHVRLRGLAGSGSVSAPCWRRASGRRFRIGGIDPLESAIRQLNRLVVDERGLGRIHDVVAVRISAAYSRESCQPRRRRPHGEPPGGRGVLGIDRGPTRQCVALASIHADAGGADDVSASSGGRVAIHVAIAPNRPGRFEPAWVLGSGPHPFKFQLVVVGICREFCKLPPVNQRVVGSSPTGSHLAH
jgi:hypothetical protein